MAFPIPNKVKRAWDEWNLRTTVLVSLFFQIVLIFLATSRKRTGKRLVTWAIWVAYLLADWVAAFSVGLISNGQGNNCDKSRVNEDLAAFWAPFLLLHLGGPDTITAFSLEDNELWIRHLLGLLIQLAAVAYVFSQSVPNELWVPTVLMFLAGFIKYAERTRALYMACLGNFKASMLPEPDAGPNYAQLMEEYSSNNTAQVPVKIVIRNEPEKGSTDEERIQHKPISKIKVVQEGYKFFKTFKGLIVDHMFSFHERHESRKFFFERNAKNAFEVMEVELNFMYDVLYTKMAAVHSLIGYFFRLTCSVLIAFSFYCFASFHNKHELHLHHFDIDVTYTLLVGAVFLDLIAHVKLIFSDWTIVMLKNYKVVDFVSIIKDKLSFHKRWSKSVSQHSLINYCQKRQFKWFEKAADCIGLKEFLDEMRYTYSRPVQDDKLNEFIFTQLREKALKARDSKIAKDICSARGNWVLFQHLCPHPEILASVSEEVEYDESLLLWHIATELCFFTDTNTQGDNKLKRKFCKILSKYMLFLLVMRPTMMSAVSGIGQIRFQDTCEEAKKFFRRGQLKNSRIHELTNFFTKYFREFMNFFIKSKEKQIHASGGQSQKSRFQFKNFFKKSRKEAKKELKEACDELLSVDTVVKPINVKGDRSKSLLFDACILAKDLNKLEVRKKWEIMSEVWVELLSYAASHIRANSHAQQLSKGGELITFVWLLMAHFGLGDQFRIEAGHARAKLIVSK